MRAILLALLALPAVAQDAPRPNVVLIMADDMGFSDIGCYGGEIRTPNLDTLAAEGLRFTQFYNTGRCCPTRASLMTGLYSHQAGVGHMTNDRGFDGYRGDLNDRCVTIAEVLRGAGYATWMCGKWHVTKHVGRWSGNEALTSTHNFPRQRGFERFFGTITGGGSYYDPITLMRDDEAIQPPTDPFDYTAGIADEAVRYVEEHDGARPFFLYVAFTAPHWPLHAPTADVAAQAGRYDGGWDALRERRVARMREMGIVDAAWGLTPRDEGVPAWEDASDKEWQARRMEVYAAQVARLDAGVGRLVAAIRERGWLEDTLVMFLADNGGCAEELAASWRGIFIPKATRDGRPVRVGNDPAVMPGPEDTYESYGKPWANASNTPFRRYKHWVHEGGISTPLIVHWPARVGDAGALRREPGHLIDVMATCVDVAGAEYPEARDGTAIRPMEGVSLVPAFDGERLAERALFWEHEGNRAVRVGKWKLVAAGEFGPWELYDLEADRTELHDLAAERPELVRELAERWRAWAERADVLPLNARKEVELSTATRFELKHGDDLPRERSPDVRNRGFVVQVAVDRTGDGVLVAQGGSTHGWALYVLDGRLVFATRVGGRLRRVVSEDAIPTGGIEVRAELDDGGQVTLAVDGAMVATGSVGRTLPTMPVDGLQVAADLAGRVGDGYQVPFALHGSVRRAVIDLK